MFRVTYCRFIFVLIIIIGTPLYLTIISYSTRIFIFSPLFESYFSSKNLIYERNSPNNELNQLIILAWTDRWGAPYPLDGLLGCKNSRIANKCTMVRDQKLLNSSSAVIFHVRDITYTNMPQFKPKHTKFLFFSHESPEMTFITLKGLPIGYFDWTFTYRLDSDVYCPYGYVEPNASPLGTSCCN